VGDSVPEVLCGGAGQEKVVSPGAEGVLPVDKFIFIHPLIFSIMLFIFTKRLALSCFEC
jgi:hypothetical protein